MQLASLHWSQHHLQKIVLLHGLACTREVWRETCLSLKEDFDLLLPDQRGHGRSQMNENGDHLPPFDYSALAYAEDLLCTLMTVPFYPTWIIGHSMGARTAAALAILKPEWLEGLILIDLPLSPSPAKRSFRQSLGHFFKSLPTSFQSREEAKNYLSSQCPDPTLAPSFQNSLVQHPAGGVHFNFDKTAVLETFEKGPSFDLGESLIKTARFGIPTLILKGKESLFWGEEDYQRERRRFQNESHISFHEIAGTGHALPFEKTKEFIQKTREFIETSEKRKNMRTSQTRAFFTKESTFMP